MALQEKHWAQVFMRLFDGCRPGDGLRLCHAARPMYIPVLEICLGGGILCGFSGTAGACMFSDRQPCSRGLPVRSGLLVALPAPDYRGRQRGISVSGGQRQFRNREDGSPAFGRPDSGGGGLAAYT